MEKSAWITWEHQQRNISMAKAVGADYYEFISRKKYIVRVLTNILKTLSVFRKGYKVIFVQNPSVLLMISSVIFNLFFKISLVVDAHNSGIYVFEGRYNVLYRINLWFLKRASLVLVSNERLVEALEVLGIFAIAVPDPLPDIENYDLGNRISSGYDVFIVCSWAEDEPIDLYLYVIGQLHDLKFGISGNYLKRGIKPEDVPSNLQLLGFIPDQEYFEYLRTSKVIVDLTLRDDCLVCGAYEAIAVGTPVIITDNLVGRELFTDGVIFSVCNEGPLLASIKFALNNLSSLCYEIGSSRDHLEALSKYNANRIFKILNNGRSKNKHN